jgi:hypothetical protein
MFGADARVETDRAARYLTQLTRHVSQMRARHSLVLHGGDGQPKVLRVESRGNAAKMQFEIGTCVLEAHEDALLLRLVADDETNLQVLQDAIAHRLATVGRREKLTVEWTREMTA